MCYFLHYTDSVHVQVYMSDIVLNKLSAMVLHSKSKRVYVLPLLPSKIKDQL